MASFGVFRRSTPERTGEGIIDCGASRHINGRKDDSRISARGVGSPARRIFPYEVFADRNPFIQSRMNITRKMALLKSGKIINQIIRKGLLVAVSR